MPADSNRCPDLGKSWIADTLLCPALIRVHVRLKKEEGVRHVVCEHMCDMWRVKGEGVEREGIPLK